MSYSEDPGVSENARRHLADVRSAIETRLAPHEGKSALSSIGDGGGVVVVRLTPSAAPIAGELKREFGDTVSITVGFKPFPLGDVHLAPLSLESSEGGQPKLALSATCEITNTRIRPGDSTTGQLLILNRGSVKAEFSAAASIGWLCAPGTLDVVGGYSGAIAAVERAVALDAGSITSLNFIVGTASCEVNNRYVVNAGIYEVVVPLSVWDAGSTGNPIRLLVRDCFVTVTDVESTGEA